MAKKSEERAVLQEAKAAEEWMKTLLDMGLCERLCEVRREFGEAVIKKSGINPHAEFMYFELKDIVPTAQELFEKYRLLFITNFHDGEATGKVVKIDDPFEESIIFSIPIVTIAEPSKYRMNEVQAMGAMVTYYRRYLYMLCLDLVERDQIDGEGNTEEPVVQEKKPKKAGKKTKEERNEIKEELTGADEAPDELQIEALKAALKKLLAADPEQEDFVNQLALQTKGFTVNLTKKNVEEIITHINSVLES